jgi:hypothetical protein
MQCAGCGVELVGQTACPGCGSRVDDDPYAGFRTPALPEQQWELTAPESYVLRYRATGANMRLEVFKIALVELLAREALTLQGALVPRVLPGRRAVWLVADGARLDTITEPALTPVLDAYDRARERRLRVGRASHDPTVVVEGVEIPSLIRAATNRSGGIKGYVKRDVIGVLQQRGLLSAKNERTGRGEDADGLLERWMDLGMRHLRRQTLTAGGDRAWVRAYMQGAGAAVLLANELYPTLARLGHSDRVANVSDQPFAFAIGPPDGDPLLSLDALGAIDGSFSILGDSFGAMDGGGGGGDGGGFG